MKKIVVFLGAIVLVNLTGCATRDYVRNQVDPLEWRLSKLEAKVSQLGEMTEVDKAANKQASDKTQQNLDVTNKLTGEVK